MMGGLQGGRGAFSHEVASTSETPGQAQRATGFSLPQSGYPRNFTGNFAMKSEFFFLTLQGRGHYSGPSLRLFRKIILSAPRLVC
jgi:hypothetical protein